MRNFYGTERMPTNGRHPVWILLLLGLLIGQVFTLYGLIFDPALVAGFSSAIHGWQAIMYNLVGAVSSSLILIGVSLQRTRSTIKRFVSALLVEQYASILLGVTCTAYAAHSAIRTGAFPFILVCLAVGLLLRVLQVRRELKDIQFDLAVATRMKENSVEVRS